MLPSAGAVVGVGGVLLILLTAMIDVGRAIVELTVPLAEVGIDLVPVPVSVTTDPTVIVALEVAVGERLMTGVVTLVAVVERTVTGAVVEGPIVTGPTSTTSVVEFAATTTTGKEESFGLLVLAGAAGLVNVGVAVGVVVGRTSGEVGEVMTGRTMLVREESASVDDDKDEVNDVVVAVAAVVVAGVPTEGMVVGTTTNVPLD